MIYISKKNIGPTFIYQQWKHTFQLVLEASNIPFYLLYNCQKTSHIVLLAVSKHSQVVLTTSVAISQERQENKCTVVRVECLEWEGYQNLFYAQDAWRMLGQYIVVMRNGTHVNQVERTARRLRAKAAKRGYLIEILQTYSGAFHGFLVKMSSDVLDMVIYRHSFTIMLSVLYFISQYIFYI